MTTAIQPTSDNSGIRIATVLIGVFFVLVAAGLQRPLAQSVRATTLSNNTGMIFDQLALTLERELSQTSLSKNELKLLPSFLCITDRAGVISLIPYERIAWVYKRTIHTQAVLVVEHAAYPDQNTTREGSLLVIEHPSTTQEVDRLFAEVTARTPWAIHEWNLQLQSNRAEVLRRFEQHRAALSQRPFG